MKKNIKLFYKMLNKNETVLLKMNEKSLSCLKNYVENQLGIYCNFNLFFLNSEFLRSFLISVSAESLPNELQIISEQSD